MIPTRGHILKREAFLSLALAVAFVLAASRPPAEVYFEQTTVTSREGAAAPGPGIRSRVWVKGRRLRLEGAGEGGPAFLLQLDLNQGYRLDPQHKVTIPVDLASLRNRAQMDASAASDLMGNAEEGDVRVVPLRAERTIAGYACKGYRLSAGPLRMDAYLASGLPIGIDAFSDLVEWTGAGQALGGIMAALRKLQGFPLETRTRVEVSGVAHETVSTVTRIEVGPQPAALFEPPADYQLDKGAAPAR
jgi:hypothetical protein